MSGIISAARRIRWPRAVAAAVALSVAALSLYGAVPRGMAGLLMFETYADYNRLREGEFIADERIGQMIEAQRRSLGWVASGDLSVDLAFARVVRQFRRQQDGAAAASTDARLLAVERTLEAGLKRSPVNPDGWRWLGLTRLARRDRPAAAAAIRMSIRTGPHVRFLAVPRLRLILRLWDLFAPDEREGLYRQIRFAWSISEDRLVALATEAKTPWPFRVALAVRPLELRRFERKYKKAKRRATR